MLLEKIKKIKVWRKGDLRAPHKPLLILFAISRINNRHIPYVDMDTHLKELLDSFGPSTDNQRPQYPFWRLQNDSIWEILNCEKVSISSSGDVSAGDLIRFSAAGGFKQKYYDELINSSDSRNEIINYLLNTNFPDSYHQAILDRLALSTDFTFKKDSRDPKFRDKILKAYEYKCCICEMQITLNQKDTILDAAHIKWHQYNGPSKESNGLCLCVIHHRLYDRGVIGIDKNLQLIVSEFGGGNIGFRNLVLYYNGKKIRRPINIKYSPENQFLEWHYHNVFKKPFRDN